MGGGKGAIHHYTTPIKAGRIIVEIGGTVDYEIVQPILQNVSNLLHALLFLLASSLLIFYEGHRCLFFRWFSSFRLKQK